MVIGYSLVAPPAEATTCNTTAGTSVGYTKDPARGQVHGINSAIVARTSVLCSSSGFNENIVQIGTGGGTGFALAGYHLQSTLGTTIEFYANLDHSGGTFVDTDYGIHLTDGTTYNMQIRYLSTCSCLRTYFGASVADSTIWNPLTSPPAAWGNTGWGLDFESTGQYNEDSIPGTLTNSNSFTQMKFLSSSDVWTATDCPLLVAYTGYPSNWHYSRITCDHTDTWSS